MQQLTSNCAPWVVNQRLPNGPHLDDPVDEAKVVGKKKLEQLQKSCVITVADLVALTKPLEGFTAKSFTTLKSKLPSSFPPTTPHRRKCNNPYMSLCGDDLLTKIKSTTAFARAYSIRDLISQSAKETKKEIANTVCVENCFFYRNALIQTSDPATIKRTRLSEALDIA